MNGTSKTVRKDEIFLQKFSRRISRDNVRDIHTWENNIKNDQDKQYLRVWREFNCLRIGPTGALSKPS